MQVRWTIKARQQGLYGIMPIGARQLRDPTFPEVLHFQTCHAAGPYSAVNVKVPPQVPVWQYIDPQERSAASRSQKAMRIDEEFQAMHGRWFGDTSVQDRAAIARIDARRAATPLAQHGDQRVDAQEGTA